MRGNSGPSRRPPVRIRFVLLFLLTVLGAWAALRAGYPPSLALGVPGPSPAGIGEASPPTSPPEPPRIIEERRVRPGETFLGLLGRLGVPPETIRAHLASPEGASLPRMVAGRPYRVVSAGGKPVEIQYEPDGTNLLRVRLEGGALCPEMEAIPFVTRVEAVEGNIEESLFGAVDDMGEDPALAMDLAEIFAWQIDFFRDLRKGDRFSVLVEKVFREGAFCRYGRILAARFVNGGEVSTGILFPDPYGNPQYYDEEGGSLRKEFLKAPLRFRHISSGFSRARLHPVTGRVQAHPGTDYAAPIGTPVRAIGDGQVVMKKSDEVNGRVLKIRHNSTYATAYAHLNSFAAGIGVGSRVRQGQIIGYVGRSGRVTGPHLHFAFYKNGRYADMRSLRLPRASSVPADRMPEFSAVRDGSLALLQAGSETGVREASR